MNANNAGFVCGAECGIAVIGTASGGTEHWSSASGTAPTIVTSGPSPMRSTRAFRINTSAAQSQLTHLFSTAVASPAVVVLRFYVYFATLPSGNTNLCSLVGGLGSTLGVRFIASDSTLRAGALTTEAASGAVVTTGVWYRCDVLAQFRASTSHTCDLQVDGVAQTQFAPGAGSNQTGTGFTLGHNASVTADYYVDDVIISTVGGAGDYPIGAGTIVGLYPNGDRTNSAATPTDGNFGHLFSATTDFGKGSGGGTATGAQNVEATSWQSLQNPLSTTVGTNFIADLAGISTEHLVWTHDALPANASTVNGVMLVATSHSASATANNQSMRLSDAAGNTIVCWNLLDLSESTITVPTFVFQTNMPTGATTPSTVNSSFFRWGDAGDVSPDPFLDGVCLEVDYVAAPPEQVQRPYGTDPYRSLLAH